MAEKDRALTTVCNALYLNPRDEKVAEALALVKRVDAHECMVCCGDATQDAQAHLLFHFTRMMRRAVDQLRRGQPAATTYAADTRDSPFYAKA